MSTQALKLSIFSCENLLTIFLLFYWDFCWDNCRLKCSSKKPKRVILYSFPQFSPMVTSYKTIEQYHNQNIDIGIIYQFIQISQFYLYLCVFSFIQFYYMHNFLHSQLLPRNRMFPSQVSLVLPFHERCNYSHLPPTPRHPSPSLILATGNLNFCHFTVLYL